MRLQSCPGALREGQNIDITVMVYNGIQQESKASLTKAVIDKCLDYLLY